MTHVIIVACCQINHAHEIVMYCTNFENGAHSSHKNMLQAKQYSQKYAEHLKSMLSINVTAVQ